MSEIAENCQGVKMVLCALKCDLRENHLDDDDGDLGDAGGRKEIELIDYKQGLEVAKRIQALRYLGTCTNICYAPKKPKDFVEMISLTGY